MTRDFCSHQKTGWPVESRPRRIEGRGTAVSIDRCLMRNVPASVFGPIYCAVILIAIAGCGTNVSNIVSAPADFSLAASPATLSLMAGATGQTVAVTANALNGFTASVNVTLSGLPSGVTANPSTLALTPGTAQNVTLAASTAAAGMATITLTGTSGNLGQRTTIALTVTAAAPAPDFSLTVAPTSLALT